MHRQLRKLWEQSAPSYAELAARSARYQRSSEACAAALGDLAPDARVVDLGSGTGLTTRALLERDDVTAFRDEQRLAVPQVLAPEEAGHHGSHEDRADAGNRGATPRGRGHGRGSAASVGFGRLHRHGGYAMAGTAGRRPPRATTRRRGRATGRLD